MSCGAGRRYGLGPTWLWWWYRLAATAPTQTLAWERPYVAGAALNRQKKKKKKKKNKDTSWHPGYRYAASRFGSLMPKQQQDSSKKWLITGLYKTKLAQRGSQMAKYGTINCQFSKAQYNYKPPGTN